MVLQMDCIVLAQSSVATPTAVSRATAMSLLFADEPRERQPASAMTELRFWPPTYERARGKRVKDLPRRCSCRQPTAATNTADDFFVCRHPHLLPRWTALFSDPSRAFVPPRPRPRAP